MNKYLQVYVSNYIKNYHLKLRQRNTRSRNTIEMALPDEYLVNMAIERFNSYIQEYLQEAKEWNKDIPSKIVLNSTLMYKSTEFLKLTEKDLIKIAIEKLLSE